MRKEVYFISNMNLKYLGDINFLAGKLNTVKFYVIIRGNTHNQSDFNFDNLSFIKLVRITDLMKLSLLKKESSLVIYGTGLYKNQYKKLHFKNIIELSHGYRPDISLYNSDFISGNSLSEGLIFCIKSFFAWYTFYGLYNSIIGSLYEIFYMKDFHDKRFDLGIPEISVIYEKISENKTESIEGKTILFIEEPFISTLSNNNKEKFFESINNLARLNYDYKILFKLHPRSNKKDYSSFLNEKNIFIQEGDIFDFLIKSQYIIGFSSTPMLFALLMRKRIFILDSFGLYPYNKTSLSNFAYIPFHTKEFELYDYKLSINNEKIGKLIFKMDDFLKLIT